MVPLPPPPPSTAASRLLSAMLLVGLCQEWSQILCSWINSVIWAAAQRSKQIYWQRMRAETWEPRNHPWHCHHHVGLPAVAPSYMEHLTQPETQGQSLQLPFLGFSSF